MMRHAAVFAAIGAGALLLLWPAALNGYPITFSDTGAFMFSALGPFMVWDKPWTYGPFIVGLSLVWTLWLPLLAQALLVSHVLWLAQKALREPTLRRHVGLCGVLALLSAAPWTTSLLMPDALTATVPLALFVLGFGRPRVGRAEMLWCGVVATLAISFHLSHLPIAAACAVLVLILRRSLGPALRAAAPIAAALLLLVATNAIGHGRPGVSPFGSVFALARLQADGPAVDVLRARCPAVGWRLCAWVDRLPMDSDRFLWEREGPVWLDGAPGGGPILLAPEASAIVNATLAAQPLRVMGIAASNTLRQLVTLRIGDTLIDDHLDVTVGFRLRSFYPIAEQNRFAAGLQARDLLQARAAPLTRHLPWVLVLGLAATIWLAWDQRRDPRMLGLTVLLLAAFGANAFATGALSKPHHRYQARIAWVLLLPPLLALPRRVSVQAGRMTLRTSG